MIKTKVTEMLGCKYPIIAGTMARVTNPGFVAAASNAGACAVLTSANYKSPDELSDAIRKTQSLTDQPFAVNINLFPALMPQDKLEDNVDATLAESVNIIETSGHKAPEDLVSKFRDGGAIWIHKCAGVRYAKKGASLGAEGVIMGTRMLTTKECPIHDNLKQAFIEAKETDTTLALRSVNNTHRIWNNKAAQRLLELEAQGSPLFMLIQAASGDKSEKMYKEGDIDLGVVSCGQCVGLIKDIPTVKELLDRTMSETEEIISRLSKISK
jgi:NAD(P)H-dependent flavin oxidoreductase YrpB (nitropropane dioxygenase family)